MQQALYIKKGQLFTNIEFVDVLWEANRLLCVRPTIISHQICIYADNFQAIQFIFHIGSDNQT